MIEPTDEMRALFKAASDAGWDIDSALTAVLAIVERDYLTCPAQIDTKWGLISCIKLPGDHVTHLGRTSDGGNVIF